MTNRALLVLPVAATIAAAGLTACQPTGSDGPSKVAACELTHHLQQAHEVVRTDRPVPVTDTTGHTVQVNYPVATFRSCTWPPAKGAATDGYLSISDAWLPGPGQSEVTGQSVAHVISGPCNAYGLTWRFSKMGGTGVGHSTAAAGKVWMFDFGGTGPSSVWPLEPAADARTHPTATQAVILTNTSYSVTDAHCA